MPRPANALAAELGPVAHFAATDVTDELSVATAIECTKGAVRPAQRRSAVRGHPGCRPYRRQDRPARPGLFQPRRRSQPDRHVQRAAPGRGGHGRQWAGRRRGARRIVNTSSVAAFDGQIGQAAYSASKGGVAALLCRSPANWLASAFASRRSRRACSKRRWWPSAARGAAVARAQVPFPPRLGRPNEFASLVRQILENRCSTAPCIRIDGRIADGRQVGGLRLATAVGSHRCEAAAP